MLDEATIDSPTLTMTGYVSHLASYISDPSTIRARTVDMFGKAPPMEVIAEIRAEHVKQRSSTWGHYSGSECDDSPDFRVAPIKTKTRARADGPRPVSRQLRKASVRKRPSSSPRQPKEEAPVQPQEASCVSAGKMVIASVAKAYNIQPADITGERRLRHLVDARSIVAMTLRARGWSLPQIGRELGARDHSTVHHLIARVPTWIERNRDMRAVLDAHLEAFKL